MAASIAEIEPVLDSVAQLLPRSVARSLNETEIVSPSLAPTWKVTEEADASSVMPLNDAALPMRSISDASWLTSLWIAALPVSDSEPFLYWTASSRTRCRMLWTSSRLPSAVCTIDTPSWMLRCAWARPLIWPRIFSEMPRPAASSAALLMRRPEDRRSIDWASLSDVWARWRCAAIASTLLLMRRAMGGGVLS